MGCALTVAAVRGACARLARTARSSVGSGPKVRSIRPVRRVRPGLVKSAGLGLIRINLDRFWVIWIDLDRFG